MSVESVTSSFQPPSEWMENDQFRAGWLSFVVILVSELGDKTFFIAAIMAMTNPRLLILAAALSALAIMTVLSALVGHVSATIISRQYTQILAAVLFLVFGLKMLWDSKSMTGKEGEEELESVNQELLENDTEKELEAMESGADPESISSGLKNLAMFLFSPVFISCFAMTFLAEFGDRSQIATIALASAEDFLYVIIGGMFGHAICTGLAVVGGRMLATKISVKTVTILGGILFLFFGVTTLYTELYLGKYETSNTESEVKPE